MQIIEIIKVALNQNFFTISDNIYEFKDGLPMGSSLSPFLSNIYMDKIEKQLLSNKTYKNKIKLWKRYVDDVFCIWDGRVKIMHLRFI